MLGGGNGEPSRADNSASDARLPCRFPMVPLSLTDRTTTDSCVHCVHLYISSVNHRGPLCFQGLTCPSGPLGVRKSWRQGQSWRFSNGHDRHEDGGKYMQS